MKILAIGDLVGENGLVQAIKVHKYLNLIGGNLNEQS